MYVQHSLTSLVLGVPGGPDGAVGELEEEVGPLVARVDLDEGVAAVPVLHAVARLWGACKYEVRRGRTQ